MILKTEEELQNYIIAGKIHKTALDEGIKCIYEGVSTFDINKKVASVIKDQGARPSFLGYNAGDGKYPFESCICINHQLVHALPSKNVIVKKGDIVTIDLGILYKGINTDGAYTVEVGSSNEQFFLNTGKRALKEGIKQAIVGKKVGDISSAMQKCVENAGFTVSVDLVGHGIGKKLHEPPQIPCFGKKGTGEILIKNMVIAVEIMYMKGQSPLVLGNDGYSFDTKDKSLSAQFEHTLIVSEKLPIVIV